MAQALVHGTAVAFDTHAILIRGSPGSGKSSLALQLIDAQGFGIGHDTLRAVLVADDQVCVTHEDAGTFLSAPRSLAGLLEIRGIGIVAVPYRLRARLVMVVELKATDKIERLPEPQMTDIGSSTVPLFLINPHEPAAAAKLRSAYVTVMEPSRLRFNHMKSDSL